MRQTTKWLLLTTILALALGMRLYPVLTEPEPASAGLGPHFDSYHYHVTAFHVYRGAGYLNEKKQPAFARGPVYPTFLAFVYKYLANPVHLRSLKDWHHVWTRVRVAQCVLDTLTCLLVFLVVRLVLPQTWAPALCASLLYCFSFYNIFYTRNLLSESVTTFLLTLAILFCVWWLKKATLLRMIAMGVASGVLALSRPEYLLFYPLFALWIFWIRRAQYGVAWRQALLYLILVCLTIAPWTLRNYQAFGHFVPVSVGGAGGSLYDGTWISRKTWTDWSRVPDRLFIDDAERKEVLEIKRIYPSTIQTGSIEDALALEKRYTRLALRRVWHDPLGCISNWIKKMPRLWYQDYIRMYRDIEPSGLWFLLYIGFAGYALIRISNAERLLVTPIWLIFIYLNLIFLPSWIEPRYGVSLMPGIICLAGIGLMFFFEKVRLRWLFGVNKSNA